MNLARLLPFVFMFMFACKSPERSNQSYTAFTGANIIDGSGAGPTAATA